MSDGLSVPSMDILPGVEERFSFQTLLFPGNPEPSTLSGFTVNICTSVMGTFSPQNFFKVPMKTVGRGLFASPYLVFPIKSENREAAPKKAGVL